MKNSSLRSFATSAALRFKFFPSASRAVGDKWAGHGGPALPVQNTDSRPAMLSNFIGSLIHQHTTSSRSVTDSDRT
jgi:hypothetical protein